MKVAAGDGNAGGDPFFEGEEEGLIGEAGRDAMAGQGLNLGCRIGGVTELADTGLEGPVVKHLARQGAEQVTDALLLLHIYIEVAHHHVSALSADALLAAAELAGGHGALEDVDADFLTERHPRYFVEA